MSTDHKQLGSTWNNKYNNVVFHVEHRFSLGIKELLTYGRYFIDRKSIVIDYSE